MLKNEVKDAPVHRDKLVSIGKSVLEMIKINQGTQDYHYLFTKIIAYWVRHEDAIRELMTAEDIERLSTLNEVLRDCHLQVYEQKKEVDKDETMV